MDLTNLDNKIYAVLPSPMWNSPSHAMFIYFLRLPLELRLHIWRLTALSPRKFRLVDGRGSNSCLNGAHTYFKPLSAWVDSDADEEWECPASKDRRIPATLHTCRESRQELQNVYRYLACGIWANSEVDEVWCECVGPYDRDFW